ncbi:hypothetical protein ACWPKS_04705 [Coraliomargarita sp. W4R72]
MKKTITHTFTALCASVLLSSYAQAANRSYNGGGTLNDWNDINNWSAATLPGPSDNALFGGPGMVLSQNITGSIGSLYVGYNTINTLEIAAGGVLTNSGQTPLGASNGGGALNITGGTLNTPWIRVGLGTTNAFSLSISSGTINVDKNSENEKGSIDIGPASIAASFTISGGTVTTEADLNLIRGDLNIVGNSGSLVVDGAFNFGTGDKSTALNFFTNSAGAVSTIFADSIAFSGTNALSIDGSAGTVGGSLTLISLANDTFSAGELSSLQSALSLNNISGSLALANGDQDLVFNVIPEASSYALFSGVVAFSFLVIRRRS